MIEFEFTSLCYVFEDHNRKLRLKRLADIEGDRLHAPFKSNRLDNFYENRDELYCNDGPQILGTVGVWHWKSVPNCSNPTIDYVESHYTKDFSPIRIVVLPVKSVESVVEQLIIGSAATQAYFCDTLFCDEPNEGKLSGVFCHYNEFKITDGCAHLAEHICALPCHTIPQSNVYNWENRNLRFLDSSHLDGHAGYIAIKNVDEIIRALILERLTWRCFKECVGTTKADWHNCKIVLKKICEKSLYETVIEKLKCTSEQAKQAVADFVERADDLIDVGDIDADVLAQIAMHHDELRLQYEHILLEKWEETNAAKIAETESTVTAIRDKAEQEEEAAKQNLSHVEIAISSAEEKRDRLLSEISDAQRKLDQLFDEIEQYEAIGNNTLAGVHQKIADAQKDMAGFLADISVFLPQSGTVPSSGKQVSFWQYDYTSAKLNSDDNIELAENWSDEFNMISQNLSHSLNVDPEFSTMLAAFLYSVHIHNIPLLIVGPSGHDVAEILSISIFGSGAGRLTLGNEYDCDIVGGIQDYNERIVSIQNMFGKGWSDALPQEFCKLKKQTVWTHPYVEDMLLEPKGLYNYMLPMFSECFVGAIPALDPQPGKRTDNFKAYASRKNQPLRIASSFRQLGFSKLRLMQLEIILSDAKAILDNAAKDRDMEILFGLLPLAILTGRNDILKKVIETEGNISNSVKAEAARYIEEERGV